MREDSQPTALQHNGLQIFSSWKRNQSNCEPRHPVLTSMTYPFFSSEETLPVEISTDNISGYSNQWKRVSDRVTVDILNDSSPTVVNSEVFAKSAISHDIVDFHSRTENWDNVIQGVFSELPFDCRDQFLEEFQYAVISSDCLNDIGGNRLPCSLKKSIMDFNKRSQTFTKTPALRIPTKYGHLKVHPNNKFYLAKTLDYLRTILSSYRVLRCLQKLKSKSHSSIKRIVSASLITVYLAIQQEYFHTQYTKYKTLVVLKEALKHLQKFSILLSKFHLRYKELVTFKPFRSEYIGCMTDKNVSIIRDLLSSNLDLFFYKLKGTIANIFSLSNTATLTKYCEIYGLHTSDLFHYFNEPADDIEEKAKRLHISKKFMLCCLLSINHSNLPNELPLQNFLSDLIPVSQYSARELHQLTDTGKFKCIAESLDELKHFMIAISSSLVGHKSILYSTGGMLSSSSSQSSKPSSVPHCKNNKSRDYRESQQVAVTLNTLRQLEDVLQGSSFTEASLETVEYVTANLQSLLNIWQLRDSTTEHEKRHSSIVPLNHGFSLDVLQPTTTHNHKNSCKEKKLYLDTDIDFKCVDETQSDIELDTDQENFHETTDQTKATGDCAQGLHRFQGLSDEELRHKLNEGILKFAVENNQGREVLRTQKSFELLRKVSQKDSQRQCKSHSPFLNEFNNKIKHSVTGRSLYKGKFSSEESIPVLYELKELLDIH